MSTRRIGTRNKTGIVLARAELIFARGDVERTTAAVSTATTVVAAEQQAVGERAAAEVKTSEERTQLRQAVRAVDEALATTRPKRVKAILDAPTGSRLGQLLGPIPENPRGQAIWCGIADRLERALDDAAFSSQFSWSKGPLDHLARGPA